MTTTTDLDQDAQDFNEQGQDPAAFKDEPSDHCSFEGTEMFVQVTATRLNQLIQGLVPFPQSSLIGELYSLSNSGVPKVPTNFGLPAKA